MTRASGQAGPVAAERAAFALKAVVSASLLALVSFGAQVITVVSTSLRYCDETISYDLEGFCDVAGPGGAGGYWAGIFIPPAFVLIGGLVAYRRRRLVILLPWFLAALVGGVSVPLVAVQIAQ